jgi:chaperonin GroES
VAIKELLEFVGKQNIADKLDDETLATLGQRVKRQFDEDTESMKDWIEGVDEGQKLAKPEYRGKSQPWQGASNFKSPILAEARTSFGDKASLEILRAKNLLKADIIGKDREGTKKELADRVIEAMNYQINYTMSSWRKEQKRLMYSLPDQGCMFKKTVFDPLIGENVSHVIQYPNFAVNQATTTIEKARSFTQVLDVDQNGMLERQAAGVWLDKDLFPEDSDGDEGSNEAGGVVHAAENDFRFLEQHCFADLDNDGYEEPYVVTIHEQTMKIVRIVPRYDIQSFIVKTKEGRVLNLVEKIKRDNIAAFEAGQPLPGEPNLDEVKLVSVIPVVQITKYGFIPAPDGTFLDVGYSHLLGAIVQSVNAITNQVTDSGSLRNMGGGFLAKGFRKKMGPIKTKPGEYIETNLSAQNLHQGILPNPNPEPSTVLFAMLEKLEAQGKGYAAIIDASGQIQANTAPTTALAIIQESMVSVSALMGRVIDSMSDEFKILFNLNRRTFDPELYKTILDDPQANSQSDFNNESMDIMPTASAEMSSKMQRIQLATVEMEQVANGTVVAAGGNPGPIVRNFFERIGSENVDDIFPEQPTDAQAEEMAKFNAQKEMENQMAQSQLELTQLQTQILMREQDRLDADTKRKIDGTIGQLTRWQAQNMLDLEKAESEDVKNNISKYTTEVQTSIDTLTAIGADDDRRRNIRDKAAAQQAAN